MLSAMQTLATSSETSKKSKKRKRAVEDIYQKKTQLEHILLRPDSYIGSVEPETDKVWVFDGQEEDFDDDGKGAAEAHTVKKQVMTNRNVTFVPGLYKIFDEILVNAADNKQRDDSMNELRVVIDRKQGFVSVFNNGQGIPVEKHSEHDCYVPELVFGHLLTSSNYDDTQKKTTGGRNGFGAKLTNAFSTEFTVETQDKKAGLTYSQTWTDNMSKKQAPKIKKCTKKDWTKVTFKPDFPKFGMTGFDDDTVALMSKRVYDIAGTSSAKLKVFLNGERLKVRAFSDYVRMYTRPGAPPPIFCKLSERWEIAVGVSQTSSFEQVSFVNGICTIKGGQHVNAVADLVTKELAAHVNKKNKTLKMKPAQVKNHLWVFVKSLIENPAFDSQTKVNLTTRKDQFGSTVVIDPKFFKKLIRNKHIVNSILSWAQFKQKKELKKNDGKKVGRISGIPKLDDANDAGGRSSADCTLILTEGDSAKALAVAGLSVVGRDKYGVFPLKGKLLNVRDASVKQIMGNTEISYLKQIMGLKQGVVYEDTKSLRYGHVMIMTDQDHDGSHIKGLLVNFFHTFWPSLLKIEGFLQEFITPIVKCKKGKNKTLTFFTLPEYEAWKEANEDGKGWSIRYYKGLGTSTAQEAKEYFSDIDRHKIDFEYSGPSDDTLIDMAFNKKKADARKDWIATYRPGTFLDMDVDTLNYTDFVDKELILFSIASNLRAIPSVVDGLKPGQRKILYSAFKKKLTKDIKVVQFAGYVSEQAAYHHGEASLQGTVVTLAQNFVGSNNVNLLVPSGQFGTRSQGGKDSASARYIFTRLNPVTRHIFPAEDDAALTFLNDDGDDIEPQWYCPVVPMVLVNGSSGIGTGWSSTVPNYNPREIVSSLKDMLEFKGTDISECALKPLHPWYRNFTGTITEKKSGSYSVDGRVEKIDDTTVLVSELPLQKWTADYKLFLESLMQAGTIRDIREYHNDDTVSFVLTLKPEQMTACERKGLSKVFKTTSTLATTNMVLFDAEGKLKRYKTPNAILRDFFTVRMETYHKRKQIMLDALSLDLVKLTNRMRFILAVIDDSMPIRNVPKATIMLALEKDGYQKMNKAQAVDADDENDNNNKATTKCGFDYLLTMPLWSLTMEKVDALREERKKKSAEHAHLLDTSVRAMWTSDLDSFINKLDQVEADQIKKDAENRKMINSGIVGQKPKKKDKKKKKKKNTRPAFLDKLNLPKTQTTVPLPQPGWVSRTEAVSMEM